jgi:hypothetical protein
LSVDFRFAALAHGEIRARQPPNAARQRRNEPTTDNAAKPQSTDNRQRAAPEAAQFKLTSHP